MRGLAGVLIHTTEDRFPDMRRFYVETLGLEPRSDRPGFVNFAWDDVRLTVALHSRIEGRATDPLRMMINLAVEDIHAVCDSLQAAGVRFIRLPERERWGGWVATFEDPDGNVLQLLSPGRGRADPGGPARAGWEETAAR